MIAFLALLQDRYGGVEEYVKTFCHLSSDDIDIIRKNLLTTISN